KALELALTITKQNRYATQEEQEILAKYSGFGGLNSAFKDADFSLLNDEKDRLEFLIKNCIK
ncbi:hypothetical protein HL734_001762, partial [Campylobacter upsaliensis]|nr:hypothetical protein [Campylobacter upsaliensis]